MESEESSLTIPGGERFWITCSIRLRALLISPRQTIASIALECNQVLETVDAVDFDYAGIEVEVPRLFGLPEEWRKWTLFMVLDHLEKFQRAALELVSHLAEDRQPLVAMRLEDLTPEEDASADIAGRFAETARRFQRELVQMLPIRTVREFEHPLFGPLNAKQWIACSLSHHKIHRRHAHKITTIAGKT
jgi:hypothetical protein